MILSVAASLAMIKARDLGLLLARSILLLSIVIYSVQASLKCIFVACYAKKSFINFVLQVLMYHQISKIGSYSDVLYSLLVRLRLY